MTATGRYRLAQRLLHWLIALLALPALGVGMTLGWLGFEGARDSFGTDITNALYLGHKSAGVLILLLMTLRLVLRLTLGTPPPVPTLTRFERIASRAVHDLLYLVLLALPVVGWLAARGVAAKRPGPTADSPEEMQACGGRVGRDLHSLWELIGYVGGAWAAFQHDDAAAAR